MKYLYISLFTLLFSQVSFAKLNILTTTTNLKSLVEYIGGDLVSVESFSKGTQDPHFLEAKPSYTMKAAKADLIVSVGLDLEVGWLPLIIRGARNPQLREGQVGSFVAGDYIKTLGKPSEKVTRADGDVHPEGNPHFMLDPLMAILVAEKLRDKLIELDVKNKQSFDANFSKFQSELNSKVVNWKSRVQKELKVISYHKTLTYFYSQFGIQNIALLEPKPGVPPSARHILGVMKKAKVEGVKLALVENYFDPTVALRVAKDVDGLLVKSIPVAVGGEKRVTNLMELYEALVNSVEGE